MLDRMRRSISGWLAYGLISLLVLSFAFWGIGDVFSRIGDEPVAEVGGEPVSAERLRRRLELVRRLSERRGENLTPEDIRERGLDIRELNILTAQKALDIEADGLGLAVSDSLVADEVREDPAFRNAFGIFDPEIYRRVLAAQGINEREYIAERKHLHTRRQMQTLINHFLPLPPGLLDRLIARHAARRVLQYALLPLSLEPAPTLDDEEVATFYRRNPNFFIVPEARAVSLLLLNPESISSAQDISQADLEQEYAINRANFLVPERYSGDMLSFLSVEAAQEASARLRDGSADFAALAREQGREPEESRFSDYGREDFLFPALGSAIAAANEQEIGGPVETDLGFTLFRLNKRVEEQLSVLAEVEDQLRARIALSRARVEIENLHDLIEDALAGGDTLDEAAARFSLTPVRADGLTAASGRLGDLPEELLAIPDFSATLFSSRPGDPVQSETLSDGYYWLEVRDLTSSRLLEFEQADEQARALLTSQRRRENLVAKTREIAEKIAAGEDFTALLAPYGRAPLTTPTVSREFTNEVFSASLVRELFAVPAGNVAISPVAVGDGIVIARALSAPDAGVSRETRETLEGRLRASLSEELLEQYIIAVQGRLGIHINQEQVETILLPTTSSTPSFY